MAAVQRRTPGVYVTELSAFPPSVVGVETAVPAFIGYTEKAVQNGKSVSNKPVAINSLADFHEVFGGDFAPKFHIAKKPASADSATGNVKDIKAEFTLGGTSYTVTQSRDARFYLYNNMRLFYANGGGKCYVVSAGTYDGATKGVELKLLQNGVDNIRDEVGPTMLVVPDALLLAEDGFKALVPQMLNQCGQLGDRVAILDVYGSDDFPTKGITELVKGFREAVGTEYLSYGIAYFPCLHTSVIQPSDMSLSSFDLGDKDTLTNLKNALDDEVKVPEPDKAKLSPKAQGLVDAIDGNPDAKPPIKGLEDLYKAMSGSAATPADLLAWEALNKNLIAHIPALSQLLALLADKLNIQPASGAMAGIYTHVDANRGVWNAPANISLTGVVGPIVKITSEDQEDLNVPLDGKAINAIRDFVGRGTLVWGARTLDGNSNDYRYIQVRRTLIYVEQSIKAALNQFVFAPNDGQTWVAVTAMISNFLTSLWTAGGLMGGKASEAFSVQCGLGSTMTGNDILNGYMRVQVTLQMIHPAEFIELTFTQKMQGVG